MIFASTSIYTLAKRVGAERAQRLFAELVEDPDRSPEDELFSIARSCALPAARTIARLVRMNVGEIGMHVDAGMSYGVALARASMFSRARESQCDVWVSVDDDIEPTGPTLWWLLNAVAGSEPRICVAPYILRDGALAELSCVFSRVRSERELDKGGRVARCEHSGFGLVAVNRAALDRLAAAYPEQQYFDELGRPCWAVFAELVEPEDGPGGTRPRRYYSEDLAFFRRARRAGVTVEGLLTGDMSHAGCALKLDEIASSLDIWNTQELRA